MRGVHYDPVIFSAVQQLDAAVPRLYAAILTGCNTAREVRSKLPNYQITKLPNSVSPNYQLTQLPNQSMLDFQRS